MRAGLPLLLIVPWATFAAPTDYLGATLIDGSGEGAVQDSVLMHVYQAAAAREVAARRNRAKLLGEEDRIGSLEAGKRADIANLRTIEKISRHGRLHDIHDLGYRSR